MEFSFRPGIALSLYAKWVHISRIFERLSSVVENGKPRRHHYFRCYSQRTLQRVDLIHNLNPVLRSAVQTVPSFASASRSAQKPGQSFALKTANAI
jgi:hypothetical protein